MILKALYDLAEREELVGDPDYESKGIAWLVRVGADGQLAKIEGIKQAPPAEGKRKPKPVPKPMPVPREPGRTSGDRAFFLVDKAEYVFGIDPDGKRPAKKLAHRFGLFRQRVSECREATDDEAIRAVDRFLEDVAAGHQQVSLDADCQSNDLFAFVYGLESGLVTDRERVRAYWKSLRQQEIAAAQAAQQRCLISGELGPVADRHTQLKFIPGASTSGVPLVSFNAGAFESYGWKGNANATVSRQAAEIYATALQRLLHPSPPDPRPERRGEKLDRRNLRLGGDTVVCYWAAEASADDAMSALGPTLEVDPDQVRDLYQSVWKGEMPDIDDRSAFYALTLSGSQGRVIVRGWFESTVAEVWGHLAQHFADLEIVRNTPKPKHRELLPQLPLHVLLQSLAVQGRNENVPAVFVGQVVEAALRGVLYPYSLLQKAVQRTRAEIGKDGWSDFERRDARAALIKAAINRRWRKEKKHQEIKPAMDPNNTQPGYLLGRMMAVIERLQQVALGDINASVVDRYFSAASATPRAVFTRLLKNARHHARKAKDNEKTQGTARWLDRQIDELAAPFDPCNNGFPAFLSLEEQGLFVLGYHQQRHALWTKKSDRSATEAEAPTEA